MWFSLHEPCEQKWCLTKGFVVRTRLGSSHNSAVRTNPNARGSFWNELCQGSEPVGQASTQLMSLIYPHIKKKQNNKWMNLFLISSSILISNGENFREIHTHLRNLWSLSQGGKLLPIWPFIVTWNSKQPVLLWLFQRFNWMIPNHYIKNGGFRYQAWHLPSICESPSEFSWDLGGLARWLAQQWSVQAVGGSFVVSRSWFFKNPPGSEKFRNPDTWMMKKDKRFPFGMALVSGANWRRTGC